VTEDNKDNVENESTEFLEELGNLDRAEEEDADVDKLLKEALKEKERFQSIAQRAQADLVNYRSRVIQEQEELRRTVKSGVLTRFIGIIDDLERAISEIPDTVEKGWHEGIQLVLRNLENSLDIEGVKKIEALGAIFDPYKHEALLYEKTSESQEGTILNVIQNGYTLNGKILRPARVVVAQEDEIEQKQEDINEESEKSSD